MQAPGRGFVRVSPDQRHFEVDGRPFFFAGANCYYLLTRAADPALRHECTRVLDDAAAAGLTVLRLWAFADGPEQWNALQPSPGIFEERVFRALDWLLAEAESRGLRLLLVLTNYWLDYGGMPQYVAWACHQRRLPPPTQEGEAAEAFYRDPDCQRMFRAAIAATVLRVNTLTHVMYRDDPTILGWSLANEPRCSGDISCTVIPRWAHHTAAFLKSIDPHHLVTVDCEGFLGPSTPDASCHNPYSCAGSGCDFASDSGSPALDFACCHLYPEIWLPQASEEEQLRFALDWLECHAALSRQLGKPLVLSEFGKCCGLAGQPAGGDGCRATYYQQLLGRLLGLMEGNQGVAGSAFWMMAAPSYPDYDGFTVYFSSTASSSATPGRTISRGESSGSLTHASSSSKAAAVIAKHAAAVAALNQRCEPAVLPHADPEPAVPNPLLPVCYLAASLPPTAVAVPPPTGPSNLASTAKAADALSACPGCACM